VGTVGELQYQCGMSLDGFIAGPNGDMSWMAGNTGPDPTVDRIKRETGALLVGRNTFGGDDPNRGTEHEGEPYGGGWIGEQFVLTHRAPERPVQGVTFVTDFADAVTAAKVSAGEKYVGVLGANIAAQCIEAGLLDEVFVFIAPVMLGDGVRLFSKPGGGRVRLERLELIESSNALRFRVIK